jgi:dolichyl-phosphate beta-glucosyltransferase
MELSIVYPVLNEASKIGADIEAAFAFMEQNRISGEVIVVDDGSTDNTSRVVESIITAGEKRLFNLNYAPNRGKGYAVRKGVEAARGEIIMFADSGNCVPLSNILPAIEMIRGRQTDIAHGSRMLKGSQITVPRKWHRKAFSLAFRKFVKLYSGIPGHLTDTQCGLKLYRGTVAKELYAQCCTDGFLFDIEIILRAAGKGYTIIEFPIRWTPDPDTRLRMLPLTFTIMPGLGRIRKMVREPLPE